MPQKVTTCMSELTPCATNRYGARPADVLFPMHSDEESFLLGVEARHETALFT